MAFWDCRKTFGVINPQIEPLWVIFADFDNLAPPGELLCVCRASVLPPDDSTIQGRLFCTCKFFVGCTVFGTEPKNCHFTSQITKKNPGNVHYKFVVLAPKMTHRQFLKYSKNITRRWPTDCVGLAFIGFC